MNGKIRKDNGVEGNRIEPKFKEKSLWTQEKEKR